MIKDFYFLETYKYAHRISFSVSNENSYSWIKWTDPEVESCIVKYSKKSIFEHYICAVLQTDFERYCGNANNNFFPGSEIMNFESSFAIHEIEHIPFNFVKYFPEFDFMPLDELAEQEFPNEDVNNWIDINKDSFEMLWKKNASETFQLLFRDRGLLLRFNQSLAQYLFEEFSPEHNGGIKRCKYIPPWCKEAIFYRDRGKCVLCHKNLNYLINNLSKKNFDHMVPLSKYGINDPCNLQLLCQECNLSKSNKEEVTSIKYITWW